MITYELAKRLKDAGFPCQKGDYFVGKNLWDETMQSDYEMPSTPSRSTWVYAPTLSELIEMCGSRFKRLVRQSSTKFKVQAKGLVVDKVANKDIHVFGKTPEEAVALLWLELNKK